MYHFSVRRSSHCCAVYELSGLAPNVIDEGFVDAIKCQAKSAGQPKVLPLLIQFTDAEENGRGRKLHDLLVQLGYKCDEYSLGPNPKSNGNHVVLFHWYPNRKLKISLVREYKYEKKENGSGELGVSSGGRAELEIRRTGTGLLRSKRRAGAGL